jgi:Rrf2 family protein
MIRLRKGTLYGLYAVHELGLDPERVLNAGAIAERYGVSEHHVAKVLQRLARARIVRGVRGAGGGFQLARDPRDITLFDVVEVFEPRPSATASGAAGARQESVAGARRLAEILGEIDEQTYYTLKSISVATLVAPHRLT